MIERIEMDLLSVKHGIIVHGCNCVGVMGAGVAAQVAKRWPHIEKAYIRFCETMGDKSIENTLGKIDWHVISPGQGSKEELIIVNAMTQLRPGSGKQVSYDAVAECFERISPLASVRLLPVYFPLIGCGLAGGKWEIVEAIIEASLAKSLRKVLCVHR